MVFGLRHPEELVEIKIMTRPSPQSAAEEFRKMDYSLNGAKTGDTVTLCGTPWTVIGFVDGPAALLARHGDEDQPVNCRTHHTVTLGAPYAAEFKFKPDRAKELVEEFWAHVHENESMALQPDGWVDTFARWLLTEKGAKL